MVDGPKHEEVLCGASVGCCPILSQDRRDASRWQIPRKKLAERGSI